MSAPVSVLAPAVGFGHVVHNRHAPRRHHFVYPLAFVRVPLADWGSLSVPGLRFDRRGLFSLNRKDHGPRDGSDLAAWLQALLAGHGLAGVCDGAVVLQTMPRMFGYVFNPVSFWFCHDRAGALRAVLAEVNNTFGERHCYLVAHEDQAPIGNGDTLVARKCFHVSPFFPVAGEYRFRFVLHEGRTRVHVGLWAGGEQQLSTVIDGQLDTLSGAALRRWLWRFPLMTFGVIARIHVQAFHLWRKRVRFFRKPLPPIEEVSS